jgi:methionyl-tRNA formyltransferase
VTEPRRAVFFGSGAFAVPSLAALASAPSVELVAVVTAPPRPAGRRGHVSPTPVQQAAEHLACSLLTPASLRDAAVLDRLAAHAPELIVLADYGRIVPPAILELARAGALNLHPSLLPRHRGASPIPAAILAGDTETGVTLMLMDAGLDSGPIVAQVVQPLTGTETSPDLEAVLAEAAASLLAASIEAWLTGQLPAHPQPSEGVTMTRPLTREDGRVDPGLPAAHLERMVRAYQPWPGTWFEAAGARVVVWAATAVAGPPTAPIGTLVDDDGGVAVATSDGRLRLDEVQPAGSRRMAGDALVRGRPALLGSRVERPSLG